MKKIKSLFKRDYGSGQRLVYNEVVEGSEWVLNGEGVPTVKFDGTCCKIENGMLYKRYDRKLTKSAAKKRRKCGYTPTIEDHKQAPEGWEPCEAEPNHHTDHWPGWLKVSETDPADKWHIEAFLCLSPLVFDGTYELVGPKVQSNPYSLDMHYLWKHGKEIYRNDFELTFEGIKKYLFEDKIEGIVWHHPDGRMVKIKRKDFGFEWPVKELNG
jgi:hypothetical protein